MFSRAAALGAFAGCLALAAATSAMAADAGLCGAPPPVAGVTFRGPVLHVMDGRSLCVARGDMPDQWVALQLDDAPAEASRGTLMAVAFAKDVDCRMAAGGRAVCTLDGASIGQLARAPEAVRAGQAWR
jgi:hypothetical protein